MKLIFERAPLRSLLRWTQRALLLLGVSLVAWCGYVPADAWNFQRTGLRQVESFLIARSKAPASANHPPPPASGGLLGRWDIPRLGISVIVIEGTGSATLRRAVGHISGTALPGQRGNVGISGHRDTFFRPLRNIRRNDVITVATLDGLCSYRVTSTTIVKPSDVSVLDPDGNEVRTLITCYPFSFVGAAPGRFIVRARRIV